MNQESHLLKFIDIEALTELVVNFNALTGLSVGITTTDPDEHIIQVGWADICTTYHQANPETERLCINNRSSICSNLAAPGEIRLSRCMNGLIHACSPIFIDEQLVAYLFSGQVLSSPPDIEFFKNQAIQNGFEVACYLDSLKQVKIINENQIKIFITLIVNNITLLAEKNKQISLTQDRLNKQSAILQKVVDLAPIGIGTAKKLKVDWCNQAMCRITGYSEQEMLDFNPIDLCINKEDRLSPEELEKEYKIKGYSERLIKTVNKAGEDVDILISSAPIDSQTPSGNIVFTIMNISEQLRNKALLIESQERLNIIIQATKVGLWDWNLITDEFITDGSNFELFEGHAISRFHTIDQWKNSIHPQDSSWVEEHLKQIKKGQNTTWSTTYRIRNTDNEYRWISSTGAIIEQNEKGVPTRAVGVDRDVTATKQLEIERIEENKKYREIVQHMNTAALTLTPTSDNKFIIDDFNPASESISKTKSKDVIGCNYIDRFSGSGAEEIVKSMQRVLETNKPERIPTKHYSFKEFDIWGELYIFLLPSKKIALIFNDHTEIKEAERELQKHHQELEETNITLKVLVRRYEEEKKKQEKRLATNVQMLVNPYLERIKTTPLTERQKSYIDIVETGLSDLSSPLATIAAARDFQLSQTETKIANLVRQGYPSKKIADIMNISIQTVHKHRAAIRKKLGVANQNVNLTSLLNQLD